MNYIRLKGRTQSWDDSRSIGWHLSHTNGIKTLHSQEISTLRVVGAVLPASWGIYTGTGATKSDYTPLIFFFLHQFSGSCKSVSLISPSIFNSLSLLTLCPLQAALVSPQMPRRSENATWLQAFDEADSKHRAGKI